MGNSFVSSIYQPAGRSNENAGGGMRASNANQGEGEEAKVNLWY